MSWIVAQAEAMLRAGGCRSDAIDIIYDELDDLCLAGHLDLVEQELVCVARWPDDLPRSIPMSAVTITRPWQAQLPSWQRLADSLGMSRS